LKIRSNTREWRRDSCIRSYSAPRTKAKDWSSAFNDDIQSI